MHKSARIERQPWVVTSTGRRTTCY